MAALKTTFVFLLIALAMVAVIGADRVPPCDVDCNRIDREKDQCCRAHGYSYHVSCDDGQMAMKKHVKIALGSYGLALFGVVFGWVLFPLILKGQLKKEMALSKKTDVRKMWEKVPFALDFKVYLFNYSNAEEVARGGVPVVAEVGPYYFEEWKEKVELEDNEVNDTVSYKRRDLFLFRPDLSGPGLTGEEVLTMPHIFMLGMAATVAKEKPAMLTMIGKAYPGIFNKPKDVFMRVKVMDLLFRGMVLDCAQTEFAPKAVCAALKTMDVSGLVLQPDNKHLFSIFGGRNGTVDPHVVTVKRGMKDVMEVGHVVAIDGQPQSNIWRDACNEYQGTDGTVFPPFLTESDRLQTYSFDLCRFFKPWYQKKTSYQGIKTNRYVANIGDLANDPELQCFCGSPGVCPPKGLIDVSPCVKAPLYVSMPHYLDSDPRMLHDVRGLTPDIDEHGIVIDFEPISGTPMVARQRVQFNIKLLRTEKLELFKDLPDTIVPLLWIEEGLALNKTFVKMLKNQLFLPKRVVGVLSWLMVSFGSLGFVGSLIFHFKDDIMRFAVNPSAAEVNKITPQEHPHQEVSVIETQEPAKISM